LHQVNLKLLQEVECPVEWAACPVEWVEWVEWAACPAWIWINFSFPSFLFNRYIFSVIYIRME
jgi:hypothetical protein